MPEQYLPASNLSGRWEDLCSVWVRDAGESYADWRAGGSFSIVPFEIALAVLGYCFQLIKSDETKYVLAWFQTERRLREEGRLPSWKTAGQFFSNFGERSTCYGSRLKAWSVDQVFFEELCKCYPNVKSRDQLPLPSIPFAIGTPVSYTHLTLTTNREV